MLRLFLIFSCLFTYSVYSIDKDNIRFSGSVSLDYSDPGNDRALYVTGDRHSGENSGFDLRKFEFYADAPLQNHVHFYAEMDWDGNESPNLSLGYLRMEQAFDSSMTLDIGKVLNPFGAYLTRKSAHQNPLFGNPLIYDYKTAVRSDSIPNNADEMLTRRGKGYEQKTYKRQHYGDGVETAVDAYGLSLVSETNPTGLLLYKRKNKFDYYLGLTNNSLSNNENMSMNNGSNFLFKASYAGWKHSRLGFSWSQGRFLDSRTPDINGTNSDDMQQNVIGIDWSYQREQWSIHSEIVKSVWEYPTISEDLESLGYYVEGQYFFKPDTYGALRIGALDFNEITGTSGKQTWDTNISRYELGVGKYINEDLLSKFYYQKNEQDDSDLDDNLLGLQMVAVF